MLAASEGLVNNVRALVVAGADINAKDSQDMTTLSRATDRDHRAVVRFLKSQGASEIVAQARDK